MGFLKGLACAGGFAAGVTAAVLGYRKWLYTEQCKVHARGRRKKAEKGAA
jgi:hypothetical protein